MNRKGSADGLIEHQKEIKSESVKLLKQPGESLRCIRKTRNLGLRALREKN